MRDFSTEFLQEAFEKIENFRALILRIEMSGAVPELLNEAFRAIHTIKGSGAMVGFDHLAESVHELETELDDLRNKNLDQNHEINIDRFLHWSDYVETYLKGLTKDPAYTLNFDSSHSPAQLPDYKLKETVSHLELAPAPYDIPDSIGKKEHVKNFPIHYRSYLQSPRSVSAEMAWSLLSLSVLSLPNIDEEKFAATALHILQTQCGLPEISRICLVRRLGLSNQYESVSSAPDSDNLILKRTRCFVDPKSSLTKISPGYVRVLNFSKAIESYKNSKSQPQRVLNILNQAEFLSGLCIGIGSSPYLSGYLFVNSSTRSLQDLPASMLPIINEVARHATTLILNQPNLESIYFDMWQKDHRHLFGSRLDLDELNQASAYAGSVMGSAPIKYSQPLKKLPPALVSHSNIAFLLARMASVREIRDCEVSIQVSDECIEFFCELNGLTSELHPTFLAASKTQAKSLGYQFHWHEKNTFSLSTMLDLCLDRHTQYSV